MTRKREELLKELESLKERLKELENSGIEQKKVIEALSESEAKYRLLFDAAPIGIGIADHEGNIIDANKSMQEMSGYSLEEYKKIGVGATYANPEERSILLKTLQEKGKVRDWEGKLKRKDGSEYHALLNADIMELGDRKVVLGIIRDISERKRIEDSLKLFSEAVESAPDGIQIVDHEGRIKYSNKAVEKIFGFSHDELIGKKVGELNVDPEIAEKVILPSILEKGRWIGELNVRHKDGHEFLIWLTTSIVKDKTGIPIAMVGIIKDITERKKVEKALHDSEKRYRTLFESAGDAIFILEGEGEEGRIIAANRTAAKMHGYSIDELLTMNIVNLDTEESSRDAKDYIKRILNGETLKAELDHRRKDGTIFPVEISAGLLEVGDHKYILAFDRDITERKQAQKALSLSNLKLEESYRTKELFTDIMHHDLLNPINIAHGYVELFLENETDLLKKSHFETMKRNLVKGIDLIDNAMKYSKLESMQNIEFECLDLKTVVTEAVKNLNHLAAKANIGIENELKEEMPTRANNIIEDVFTNLISNAIKYAPDGKKIVVDGKDENSSWIIRVMDFGPGIKDADKKLVFERFRREDKKGVKGSGLGLAIARKIVELHKGRIWVEDNPEGGAVFVVEIPKS